jgi:hypothetical protein
MLSDIRNEVASIRSLLESYFSRSLAFRRLFAEKVSLGSELLYPSVKDPISRCILLSLLETEEMNLTQLTRAIRGKIGRESRKSVRRRVGELSDKGLLEVSWGRREVRCSLKRKSIDHLRQDMNAILQQ